MPSPTACRTPVQGDCSTERPFLSISDRLDGSEPMEAVGRFFLCPHLQRLRPWPDVLLRNLFAIGPPCFCTRGWPALSKQCCGRFAHALRMREYRARQEKVTHQGSPPPPIDALLAVDSATSAASTPPDCPSSIVPAWHCHFCGCRCSAFVRSGFLRGRPVQARARQRAQQRPGGEDDHSP